MTTEKKNKLISAGVTAGVMALMMVLMVCCGFTETVPPPPAKKALLIELTSGGGGGGGVEAPSQQKHASSSDQQVATQNAEDAPAVTNSKATKKTTDPTPAGEEPKPDPKAAYRPGRGGGSGGGTGTGTGSGNGSGLGPGTGGGSGGGIGYGTGTRGFVNNINVTVNEDGVVYVEVHIDPDGNVVSARVINDRTHPTTITNSNILNECVARAKQAKYTKGKEELRIIMFKR